MKCTRNICTRPEELSVGIAAHFDEHVKPADSLGMRLSKLRKLENVLLFHLDSVCLYLETRPARTSMNPPRSAHFDYSPVIVIVTGRFLPSSFGPSGFRKRGALVFRLVSLLPARSIADKIDALKLITFWLHWRDEPLIGVLILSIVICRRRRF